MKTRTLLAATATALLGLTGGGFFHQAQAIDVCQDGSGDICADLLATAEGSAPDIIPDPTRQLLWDTIDATRVTIGGVVLPAELSSYEQMVFTTVNSAISPYQPTVVATTAMALTTTSDAYGTVRSGELPPEAEQAVDDACGERHGDDHPGKGQGHDKGLHCDNVPVKLPHNVF